MADPSEYFILECPFYAAVASVSPKREAFDKPTGKKKRPQL